MLSIIIPTRWYGPKPQTLIESILSDKSAEWVLKEIICVMEFDKSTLWWKDLIQQCESHDIILKAVNQDGYGVSESRNQGADLATQEHIMFMDDDITIEDGFIWNMIDEYNTLRRENNNHDIALYPTVLKWDTDDIWSRWYRYYNRLFARPISWEHINNWKYKLRDRLHVDRFFWPKKWDIQLSNIICMLITKDITQQVRFDDKMLFVYEDLDWTYRVYKSGYPIFVSWSSTVRHYEWYRTKMEQMYLGNKESIYYKTRHRIRFAIKNSNTLQRISYYISGFWISNIRTFVMICRYSEKRSLHLWALWKGIKDGLKVRK